MAGPPYLPTIVGNKSDLQAPRLDWANGQVLTVGSSSVASAVINANFPDLIELCSTTNCWYTVGAGSPFAAAQTAGSQYLPAGTVRYVYVPAGWKIAVIQDLAAGFAGLLPGFVAS